jgi:PAS domain S-box-containing protein
MTQDQPDVDVTRALAQLTVPASVVDRDGRIRWMNRGAIEMVGDRVGEPFARTIAPQDLHRARGQFAKKLIGEPLTEYAMTLVDRAGRRVPVRVSSAPLWENGEITGVFGIAYRAGDAATGREAGRAAPQLTARQHETLALLADGLGTSEIAARLGVAEETARNHIRGLLRQLDAHNRLQAVVRGYRLGLLEPHSEE